MTAHFAIVLCLSFPDQVLLPQSISSSREQLILFLSVVGGEPYVSYKGLKYYLSDEPGKDSSTFLEQNCVIYLDLSKTDDVPFRSGNAYV
ncbi:hypothetical protein ACTXT7_012037 [Hymenolepis weldensis]